MKKYFALLLSLFIVIASTTSCADDGERSGATEAVKEGEIQVGVVFPTRDDSRWLQDEVAFTLAFDNAGISSETMYSQDSTATELSNVEALIEKGMKVLIICAHDPGVAGAAVQKAKDAGVTVVCYDRLITGIDVIDYYVGFDSYKMGVEQGNYLINKHIGGKAVPLYLYAGPDTDNDAIYLFSGAWSVLNKAVKSGQFNIVNCDAAKSYIDKDLDSEKDQAALTEILGTINTDWDAKKAATLAETNLKATGAAEEKVAILAPNDKTARAISNVFEADVKVKSWEITGRDAELLSLKYIQEGKQGMTVLKENEELVQIAVDMVGSLLNGETPKTTTEYYNLVKAVPSITANINIIDKAVLDKYIENGTFNQEEINNAK